MRELRERFRALDDLGDPPDVWSRAESRVPAAEPDLVGTPWRRAGIAAVALVVAAAAIAFAALPFLGGDRTAGPGPGAGWLVFAGHPFREEPPPTEGFVEVSGGDEEPLPPDDLYLSSIDGSTQVSLTNDGLSHGPVVWSADGAWIAYTAYDTDRWVESLWVVDADGSDPRLVCEGCTSTFFVQRERECGIDSCWGPGATPRPNRLAASPDGRRIAATPAEGDTVDVIDVVTGSAVAIQVPAAVDGVSWAPDGEELAVAVGDGSDRSGLYVVDTSGGAPRHLLAAEPYGEVSPAWSPDGYHARVRRAATGQRRPDGAARVRGPGVGRRACRPRDRMVLRDLRPRVVARWLASRGAAPPGRSPQRRPPHRRCRRPGPAARDRLWRRSSVLPSERR